MTEQARKPIYSPLQVGVSTLLAGPMGGTHLLWSNFNALGQFREAKIAAAAGVSITTLLLLSAFANTAKANFGMLVGLILALSARFVAEIYQLKKEAIAGSVEYTFRSNWNVLGISVAWLAMMLVIVALISYVLALFGIDVTG